RGNRFDRSAERVSVEAVPTEPAKSPRNVLIEKNRADASIVCGAARCSVLDNIVMGLNASILLRGVPSRDALVSGNYLDATAPDDDGHYALSSENPDARIEANIVRGGTTCVLAGTRTMRGNIIIASASLKSATVRDARSHQVVGGLPPGARFEENLLIGP